VTGRLRPDTRPQPAAAQIAGVEQTPVSETRAGLDLEGVQRQRLDRWGWADRDAGLATIPIDRAIDHVVREASP
jgi:hypothetical protein